MVKGATDVTALIPVLKAAGQKRIKSGTGDHTKLAAFSQSTGKSP